jgi:hypothetical protein
MSRKTKRLISIQVSVKISTLYFLLMLTGADAAFCLENWPAENDNCKSALVAMMNDKHHKCSINPLLAYDIRRQPDRTQGLQILPRGRGR